MLRATFILMFALVLLGFLISNSINMYNDLEALKAESQNTSRELEQLQSDYKALSEERDALNGKITNLNNKLSEVERAYAVEHQARLKAEGDSAIYKGMMSNMMGSNPSYSLKTCIPKEEQASAQNNQLLSGMLPVGASSIIGLLVVSLLLISRQRIKSH